MLSQNQRLRTIIDAQLAEQGGEVLLHRRLGHAKLIGDLLVEQAAPQPGQNARLGGADDDIADRYAGRLVRRAKPAAEALAQVVETGRFGNEARRAMAAGGGDRGLILGRRDHHHRDRGIGGAQGFQPDEAATVGQLEVEQDEVGRRGRETRARFGQRGRLVDHHVGPDAADDGPQGVTKQRMIVREQQPRRHDLVFIPVIPRLSGTRRRIADLPVRVDAGNRNRSTSLAIMVDFPRRNLNPALLAGSETNRIAPKAPATRKYAFPPVADDRTRLLVLGSLPGEASLAAGRYYAHPRNQFWRLMAAVTRQPLAEASYESRLAMLGEAGVGLWDVVHSAERAGSLDAAIRDHRANPLVDLAARLPRLGTIAFNGGKAAAIGRRLPGIGRYALIDLPSSSPAHARPFEDKLRAWMALARQLDDD